jgi:hypothetical protein
LSWAIAILPSPIGMAVESIYMNFIVRCFK